MYYVKLKTPFTLRWGITLAGSSLNLADATLRVLLKNARGSIDITKYIEDIEDNVITLSHVGLNYLGEYSLNLRVQSKSTPTFEVDEQYVLTVTRDSLAEEDQEIIIDTVVKINDGKLLDDALSIHSISGVQNKVITEEFVRLREEMTEATRLIEENVADEVARLEEQMQSMQESLNYALEQIEYLLSREPENPDEPVEPEGDTSNILGKAILGSMVLS